MMSKRLIFLWLCLLSLVFSGCDLKKAQRPPHEPFMARIREATTDNPSGGLNSEIHLQGIPRVQAQGFEARPTFDVATRTGEIRRFPCSECHIEPLEHSKAGTEQKKKAHWEIKLQHAGTEIMQCTTCHSRQRMNLLHTLNGRPVELNHSYQLCAQCHSVQAKDWSGGAHGKRLGGWAPPRVINNCTACHNPHQPRLEKRWPSRASRLPRSSIE